MPWQWRTAFTAKIIFETISFWHLVTFDQRFTFQPFNTCRFDTNITGVPGAGSFAAAQAVTVVKGGGLSFNFVGDLAAQAATG